MMRGLLDGLRRGRDEGLAGYARRAADMQKEREYREAADDRGQPFDDGQSDTRVAELENELRAREVECEENRQLQAEAADAIERFQARLTELEAAAEPLLKALRLSGAKTVLVNRFHPDKHPDADAGQQAMLTDALQTINDAYAIVARISNSA